MKILLADDHRMMRDGLRAILEKAGEQVVGEASNGRETLIAMRAIRPDIVVMDISMPELNGIDATKRLIEELPDLKVIALSMNSDRRYVVAMFKAGAVGYLLKNSASDELLHAVHAVSNDLTYVSPAIASIVVGTLLKGKQESRPPRELSLREREVLQLLAEGKSSKEIALGLNLALPTVETHRRQIMDKLSIRSIAELTKYAIREGLTPLD